MHTGDDFLSILSVVIQLIFLEGILSIDNAAVLGAMVSVLPTDKPVPYPRALHFLQAFTDRVFGTQQMAALKVGLLGAYAGRGLMLVLAKVVMDNEFLQIVGAAYLIKLAFEHLAKADQPGEHDASETMVNTDAGFWGVVLSLELADLAFSLDNVVAAVALSDKLWVVMVGVGLGIITMRFAAGIFTYLIKREPILSTAAYLVVLNIGVEILLKLFAGMHFEAPVKFAISAATIVLCIAYARIKPLQLLRPVFVWFAQGMGNMNELIDWALRPLMIVIKLLFKGIAMLITPLLPKHPHQDKPQPVAERVPHQ